MHDITNYNASLSVTAPSLGYTPLSAVSDTAPHTMRDIDKSIHSISHTMETRMNPAYVLGQLLRKTYDAFTNWSWNILPLASAEPVSLNETNTHAVDILTTIDFLDTDQHDTVIVHEKSGRTPRNWRQFFQK